MVELQNNTVNSNKTDLSIDKKGLLQFKKIDFTYQIQ